MALYVNTDKLDSAGENLTNSYGYFNSAISNISSGKSGLDSGVLSSVSSSLSTASSKFFTDVLYRSNAAIPEIA